MMKTSLITKLQGRQGFFEYNHCEGTMWVSGTVTLEEMVEAIDTINGQNEPPSRTLIPTTVKESAH